MQKYSTQIAEAIIPLLGFYSWGWSWYFILLFFILDAFAKVIVLHLKSKKIYAIQGGAKALAFWKKSTLIGLAVEVLILILLHWMHISSHPTFELKTELVSFLSYKEMGFSQGWVLVPLIGLNVWMQYKFIFIKTKEYKRVLMSSIWKEYLRNRYVVLAVVGLGCLVSLFLPLPDSVIVWASILLPILSAELLTRLR